MTGSIIRNGNLFRLVLTAVLAGTRLRCLSSSWPSGESMKSVNSNAACGRGARLVTATAFGRPNVGVGRLPLVRRPVPPRAPGFVVVDRRHQRDFPRRDQLGEQRMPGSDLRLHLRQLAEEREALVLAHVLDDGG